MQRREKILAVGFGVVVAAYAGNWLFQSALEGPLEARRAKTARLEDDIARRERELRQARTAAKELSAWQAQSLPADVQVARSLYQAWLLELVDAIGLQSRNVDSGEAVNRKGLYQALSFTVRGRGTLDQLTRFLYEFYRAGHLHQIHSLSITPLSRTGELDLSIGIEALVVNGADRKDQLSSRSSERLASAAFADYQPIVGRDLFTVGGADADAAGHTYLTAVLDVDGEPEAWFTLRERQAAKAPQGAGDRRRPVSRRDRRDCRLGRDHPIGRRALADHRGREPDPCQHAAARILARQRRSGSWNPPFNSLAGASGLYTGASGLSSANTPTCAAYLLAVARAVIRTFGRRQDSLISAHLSRRPAEVLSLRLRTTNSKV